MTLERHSSFSNLFRCYPLEKGINGCKGKGKETNHFPEFQQNLPYWRISKLKS